MRITLVVLALGGCVSSEPVRDGQARIVLDSADHGSATYRVIGGSNDSACAHGEHFTPLVGAEVRFGPSGGELVSLTQAAGGEYSGTAPTVYASSYQFSVDGELFELVSPASFSATIKSMSARQAVVELSDASVPSNVLIHMPDGNSTARTVVGSPAVIDADFSKPGDYQIELVRSVDSVDGVVEILRQTTLTMY